MSTRAPAVWFVDDDDDDRLFIRSAFEDISPPVTVLTLNNGEQLLAELANSDALPQLILLDLNMPGLNGFDTIRKLRTTSRFADVPVVMLTTSTHEADRQQSLESGANDFIIKPTSYMQLAALAQELRQIWVLVG